MTRRHFLFFVPLLGTLLSVQTIRLRHAKPAEVRARPVAALPALSAPRRAPAEGPAIFSALDEQRLRELAGGDSACALAESRLAERAPTALLLRLLPPLRDDALEDFSRAAHLLRAPSGDAAATEPLLRQLSDDDPANAVPALYLAFALRAAGDAAADAALVRALSLPETRFPSEESLRSLELRSLENPATFPAAVALGRRFASPDLFPVEDFVLERIADGDEALAALAYGFGRRLMATALGAPAPADAYGFGRRVAATAWRRLHPGASTPAELAARRARVRRAPTALEELAGSVRLGREACEAAFPAIAERLRGEAP